MSVWERQVKVHEAMVKEKTRVEPESADQMGAEMGLDLIRDEATEFSFLEMMQVTPVNIRHLFNNENTGPISPVWKGCRPALRETHQHLMVSR